MSTRAAASGPTAILFMYGTGGTRNESVFDTAMVAMAYGRPKATESRDCSASTATSTSGMSLELACDGLGAGVRAPEGYRVGGLQRVDRDVGVGNVVGFGMRWIGSGGIVRVADDDARVPLDGAHPPRHRSLRGAIGGFAVALAHPPRRRECRGFGDADQLEGEVALHRQRVRY